MDKLEKIEKRIVSKSSVMHPVAAIHLDDAAWLIARVKEGKALAEVLRGKTGREIVTGDPVKMIRDFLANLEAPDA